MSTEEQQKQDEDYLRAADDFCECREKLLAASLWLDVETAKRDPNRVGERPFSDVFAERSRTAEKLRGVAQNAAAAAQAVRKLTPQDCAALHLNIVLVSGPQEPTPLGVPPPEPVSSSWIAQLKEKVSNLRK